MFKGLTKEEKSWVMFDWAGSAYTMTVLTVVMSMYFLYAAQAGGSEHGDAYWGFANTVVTLVSGFLSPIIGTLSGFKGMKKRLFTFFTFIGVSSTLALAVVPYTWWWLLLVIFVISGIGFNAANKVYDAFLADVSPNERMDRVSSLGFGMGYIGGAIGFILSIIVLVLSMVGVIDVPVTTAYRIAFLVTGVWWFVFSIPMFKNVKQKIGVEPEPGFVKKSFANIGVTLKEIAKDKKILLFLLAFFLYSDGVGSIIRMAVVFGAGLGIDELTLLAVMLVVQFVAFPFAILYGAMAKRFGAKNTIYFGIATYCVVCVVALMMTPDRDIETLSTMFWVLAILVGTAQGGIQALSRSYFGRIIPKEKSNEYFGIYNVFGRFASFIGTSMFGVMVMLTGQANLGVAVIAGLFIIAAIIFKFVPDDRKFL